MLHVGMFDVSSVSLSLSLSLSDVRYLMSSVCQPTPAYEYDAALLYFIRILFIKNIFTVYSVDVDVDKKDKGKIPYSVLCSLFSVL